jgi:DnaK suppressor protein
MMVFPRAANNSVRRRRVILRAHIDAELSSDQLKMLSDRLLEKRVELGKQLTALEQDIAARDDCSVADAAEAASLQEGRARASGIADQYQRTISEIDYALKRLEIGSYGVSEVSGEPIAFERLALIPWARTAAGD